MQYLGDNTAQNTSSGVPVVTPDVPINASSIAAQTANIVLDDSDDAVEF